MESPAPSPTQLLTLTALVPSKKPRPPNISHHLADLLQIINPPEILNYLFAAEPIHLPPLLSANLSTTALTFQQSTTRVEPPPPLTPSPSFSATSHHIASSFLLAPALTLPPLTTLGVGVMQSVHMAGQQILPLAMRTSHSDCLNFRFLSDPSRNIILLVYDAPEDDRVVIYLSSNASLKTLHSFTASFQRTSLLQAIRSKGDAIRLDDLHHSLLFIFTDLNVRTCPFCAAPPFLQCACQIPLVTPTNPLDFAYFKRNFLTYFGSYQGLTTMQTNLPPHFPQQDPVYFGARASTKGLADPSLIERLRSWALCTYVTTLSGANPLESVAFPRDPTTLTALEDSPHDDDDSCHQDSTHHHPPPRPTAPALHPHHPHHPRHPHHHHHHAQRHGARGTNVISDHLTELLAEVAGDDSSSGHTPVSVISSQIEDDETWIPFLPQQQPVNSFTLNQLVDGGNGLDLTSDTGLAGETSTINTESEHGTFWRDGSMKRGREEQQSMRSPGSESTGIFHTGQGGSGRSPGCSDCTGSLLTPQSVPAVEEVGIGVSEFVLHGRGGVNVSDVGVEVQAERQEKEAEAEKEEKERRGGKKVKQEENEDVHEVLRRMKDEERKERNRISARRSNRKKKEKGVALEAELKRIKGVADELRAKEVRLREENWLLRGAFQGQG